MRTETKRKIIHYKRVVMTNSQNSLQGLLTDAMGKNGKAAKANTRREVINQDDQSFRLVNHHRLYNGMLFGQMLFFEAGKSQQLITMDEDADFYPIQAITTESINNTEEAKNRREFVNSMLYFGVFDNHLVVMQSSALKARDLEAHLSWLLGTCTDVLGKNNALLLQDKPSEATISKIQKNPVKSVMLGSAISADMEQMNKTQGSTEGKTKKVKWVPCGMGIDMLRAVLGEEWLGKLDLDDSLDDSNLQVNLEITYLRKTSRNGQRMLDNIATSLRHMDGADVRVDLYGGGTITGDDLKLSGPVSVKTINGLVDEGDLYHQMHSWLVSKVKENEIENTNNGVTE